MDHSVRYREWFKRIKQKTDRVHICGVNVAPSRRLTTRVLMDSHSRAINVVTSHYV